MAERAEVGVVVAGGEVVAAAGHRGGRGFYPGVSDTMLNKKIDWNCSLSIDLFAEVQIGAD
jgi:hypothetical protein